MDYLIIVLAFIVVIGILVTFHELGHFLVARFFNVGVEKFSVGFGKPIFSKKIGYTEYILASIPLGGYVKMTGELDSEEVDEELAHLSFQNKKVYQRALIVAAGPLFNFFLAILIYFLLFSFSGVPKSFIGEILPDSPAARAGIMRGDTILNIDGKDARAWNQMEDILEESEGRKLDFEILRDGSKINKTIAPEESTYENEFKEKVKTYHIGVGLYNKAVIGSFNKNFPAYKTLKTGDEIVSVDGKNVFSSSDVSRYVMKNGLKEHRFGIKRGEETLYFNITPKVSKRVLGILFEPEKPVIKSINTNYSGFKSGLKAGDEILSVNKVKFNSGDDISKYIMENGAREYQIEVKRDEKTLLLKVTPQKPLKDDRPVIGIIFESNPPLIKLSLFNSVKESFSNSVYIMKSTVVGIYKMINGSVSSDNIGGPIFIAQIAGKVVKKGLKYYLNFIAVLSINLAILNLIPIPVLDGGHLMFYGIEAVSGKPVNKKFRDAAQHIGIVLLFMLIIYSVFNDISRIFN